MGGQNISKFFQMFGQLIKQLTRIADEMTLHNDISMEVDRHLEYIVCELETIRKNI